MLARSFTRINLIKTINIEKCNTNCLCVDRLKRLSQKPLLNIIDEAFTNFQIKENHKEYVKCFNKKIST